MDFVYYNKFKIFRHKEFVSTFLLHFIFLLKSLLNFHWRSHGIIKIIEHVRIEYVTPTHQFIIFTFFPYSLKIFNIIFFWLSKWFQFWIKNICNFQNSEKEEQFFLSTNKISVIKTIEMDTRIKK